MRRHGRHRAEGPGAGVYALSVSPEFRPLELFPSWCGRLHPSQETEGPTQDSGQEASPKSQSQSQKSLVVEGVGVDVDADAAAGSSAGLSAVDEAEELSTLLSVLQEAGEELLLIDGLATAKDARMLRRLADHPARALTPVVRELHRLRLKFDSVRDLAAAARERVLRETNQQQKALLWLSNPLAHGLFRPTSNTDDTYSRYTRASASTSANSAAAGGGAAATDGAVGGHGLPEVDVTAQGVASLYEQGEAGLHTLTHLRALNRERASNGGTAYASLWQLSTAVRRRHEWHVATRREVFSFVRRRALVLDSGAGMEEADALLCDPRNGTELLTQHLDSLAKTHRSFESNAALTEAVRAQHAAHRANAQLRADGCALLSEATLKAVDLRAVHSLMLQTGSGCSCAGYLRDLDRHGHFFEDWPALIAAVHAQHTASVRARSKVLEYLIDSQQHRLLDSDATRVSPEQVIWPLPPNLFIVTMEACMYR